MKQYREHPRGYERLKAEGKTAWHEIHDGRGFGLRSLDTEGPTLAECGSEGINCFGPHKQRKGFSGYVSGITSDIREVHP